MITQRDRSRRCCLKPLRRSEGPALPAVPGLPAPPATRRRIPDPTSAEWSEFEQHFDTRKVELGDCGRPYASDCRHEHACIRCPLLRVNPQMAFRLEEIETDLIARRARADAEGWLGEIEGIDLTLRLLRQKQVEAGRLTYVPQTVDLGIPVVVPRGRQERGSGIHTPS
ncbi:hypothetical protein ACFYV5_10180 [Streptomyces sp. NPDC003035]|uniref:hypothetical protein n=1 Tax=Streptomyces sp. NPDC003035 TaxID=3364676 RepID=UPI0036C5581E